MKIAGIQKLTLLDFPGRCAATIFTPGCDLRCPFCHNASLVDPVSLQQAAAEGALIDPEDVLSFLKQRFGRLTGLAVTGGEPLMQSGLTEFLLKVKALGYAVKLDTNGTWPERLQSLIDSGAVDYIAMDFKNSRAGYAKTAGLQDDAADAMFDRTLQSARIIMESGIEHEFRTTVVAQLHTVEDIRSIAQTLAGEKKYFLQSFTDSGDILGGPSPAARDGSAAAQDDANAARDSSAAARDDTEAARDGSAAAQDDIKAARDNSAAAQDDTEAARDGRTWTAHFSAHSKETMQQMLDAAREFIPEAQLRGI